MKKISFINYVKAFALIIITILFSINLSTYYISNKKYIREKENINKFISIVKIEELENYIMENYDIFLYLSYGEDNIDEFETEFITYIKENEIEHEIVYVDISLLDEDSLLILKRYFSNTENMPKCSNLIYVKDEDNSQNLYNEYNRINMEDVKNFIERNR